MATTKKAPLFSRKTTKFLGELEKNNNRDWFNANKDRYEEDVLEPALAFIRAMQPRLAKISKHITAVDKKSGGSLLRIYRDVRFSKDKRPYNTHVSMRFMHEKAKKTPAPGFYVRLQPDAVFLGTGLWQPDPPALAKVRKKIVADPKAWKSARDAKAFRDAFGELDGESLKRPPKGFDPEHPFVEDLKRKDFVGFAKWKVSAATKADFPDAVAKAWKGSNKLMTFLCGALKLPY